MIYYFIGYISLMTRQLFQVISIPILIKGISFGEKFKRSLIRKCLDITMLALCVVMAGTGNLKIFKILRELQVRGVSSEITFGNNMAVSMAIGFLFMGGGR